MADSSTEHTVIKRICAKCNKTLGYTDGHGQSGISHGLCPVCRDETLRDAGLEPDDLEPSHWPEDCTNPMCDEPMCVQVRQYRTMERMFMEEDKR